MFLISICMFILRMCILPHPIGTALKEVNLFAPQVHVSANFLSNVLSCMGIWFKNYIYGNLSIAFKLQLQRTSNETGSHLSSSVNLFDIQDRVQCT